VPWGGPASHAVVNRILVVVPDLSEARLAGLGRGLCEALLGLTLTQKIDKVLDLGHALWRQLLDLVEQDLIRGIHRINSLRLFVLNVVSSLPTAIGYRIDIPPSAAW
jgi:hypothetical protein